MLFQQLREKAKRYPKVDLHRHLEGSIRFSTILDIATRERIPLPTHDPEELRRYVQVNEKELPDYHSFLGKFRILRQIYSSREAIQRIAYEVVLDAAKDNVRYLELRFNPLALSQAQGFPLLKVSEWVIEAGLKAAEEGKIRLNFLITITRDTDLEDAKKLVQLALELRSKGVVGLDLAGDEVNYRAYPFAPLFRDARRKGLGITIHAGEVTGAGSVYEAVEILGAHRIGHGVKAVEDVNVLDLLKFKKVVLEMCLTSNLQTGAIKRLDEHPFLPLLRLGILVTLNTDDPGISGTSLTDEYLLAIRGLGMTQEELTAVIRNGILGAFLLPSEKVRLVEEFNREFESMGLPLIPRGEEVWIWR
jgi:adenosine deaminase